MRQLLPRALVEEGESLIGREAELTFLLRHMQLEQTRDDAPTFLPLLVDFRQEVRRIGSMDERDVGRDVFHLVRLQMPDEVPFQGGKFGELLVLALELLCVTLAKERLPRRKCLADGSRGVELRHGHQPHTLGQLIRDFVYFLGNHRLIIYGRRGINPPSPLFSDSGTHP